jgi:pimeloyl-ACP methyl ester carboxylesterase
MADTYVLVHGAWHTGAELEAVAENIRKGGHTVHCPTAKGNRPGDDRATVGLNDAIQSIADYIQSNNLKDIRLVGQSYGGMLISGVADRMPERIKRLVYMNAFVPMPGESLNDLVPPMAVCLLKRIEVVPKEYLLIVRSDLTSSHKLQGISKTLRIKVRLQIERITEVENGR